MVAAASHFTGSSVPELPTRAASFAVARRHSRFVRGLRFALGAGIFCTLAALVAYPFVRPVAPAAGAPGVSEAGLSGSRIVMQSPHLSGIRTDGRPYDIEARSGEQSVKSPNLIDLNEISARLGLPDSGTIRILAGQGLYDSTKNTMDVPTSAQITGDSGFNVALKNAQMDFAAGMVVSKDPVQMQIKGGAISANALDVGDSGQRIGFSGGVHSTFFSPGAEGEPAPGAPDAVQKSETP